MLTLKGKPKSLSVVLVILALILILVFLYRGNPLNEGQNLLQANSSNDLHVEIMHGDIVDNYETIESMQQASDIVALVEITESENIIFDDLPFTISSANVKKVYQNDGLKENTLQLLETGGVMENIEYAFEGNKVLKKNEKAVVFLQKYEGPITDNAYVIAGVFQGKFKLEQDEIYPSLEVNERLSTISDLKSLEAKLK